MRNNIVRIVFTTLILYCLYLLLFPRPIYLSAISGMSMAHLGLEEGMTIEVDRRMPEVGEMVVFDCHKKNCPEVSMVKQVKKIRGDCYWLEGQPNSYEYKGGMEHSVDSRRYGYLCGEQMEIYGVVKPLKG